MNNANGNALFIANFNTSQQKSAIFVLSRTVGKSLADKLLLYKKNDGYGFQEESTGD
jgi:hypothetical protein